MKALTLENKEELIPFLRMANYQEYNSNIITLLMWSHKWQIYFETYENFALVLSEYESEHIWLMPQCLPQHIPSALQAMKSYSQKQNIPFVIHEITKQFQNYLDEMLPNQYYYESDRDTDDYIYLCEQHRTLSGKKMQKRRNHFNAFMNEYEGRYSYVSLNKNQIPDIYQMLDTWTKEHGETTSTDEERYAIHFLLTHMDELPIFGGCIYIDDKLEAFCIQSMINNTMMQVHIEKANREIRGLYVAIVKFSLDHLNPSVTYFNREDDMGLANLRKAKLDMKPIFRIKKLFAYPGITKIRTAIASDLPQLKKLWRESFPDESDRSTTFFFRYLLQFKETYIYESNDSIIAMGQARKMVIELNKQSTTVSFIVGIATSKRYQQAGYMDKLLRYMLEDIKEEPITILQAYNWNLYKPYGFEITYEMQEVQVQTINNTLKNQWRRERDPIVLLNLYNQFTLDKNGYRKRDLDYYKSYFIPYAKNEEEFIFTHTSDGFIDGYMVLDPELAYIREWIPTSKTAHENMLNSLWINVTILASKNLKIPGKQTIVPQMMVKKNKEIELNEPLWIDEFL